MYQREFDSRLRRDPPRAVLLYGESKYLIEHYLAWYLNHTDAHQSAMTLYYEHYTFDRASAYLSQDSLFGGTSLLVVRHSKKIPKKELDHLIDLTARGQQRYFLYLYEGADRDARSLQNSFRDHHAVWVRLFEPSTAEAIKLLASRANMLGVDIDAYHLGYLLAAVNHHLALAANELEKLAILEAPIRTVDIDRLVYASAAMATEKLLEALFEKRPTDTIVQKLLESGEDPHAIVAAIGYFLQQLLHIHMYIKLHGHADPIAIFGYKMPRQILEKKTQTAIRIKPAVLLRLHEVYLEEALAIKRADAIGREALLYSMCTRLAALL